jgi:signal transduction histidine kinase/DNA-binding response OmpR family regulator
MSTTPSEQVNVLLVDDRPENLAALSVMLEQPDYRLVTATSGAEALKLVLQERFAVILLDVVMPVMDGLEVASLIKTRERSRHIPIIFLTAAGADLDRIHEAYSLGAVDYLIKPVAPHVVRAKVAVFVELYRKSEEVKRQAQMLIEQDRNDRERQLAELRAEGERRARAEAERMQRRWEVLAEVSRLLNESLEYAVPLAKVARHLVETACHGCIIELIGEDLEIAPVAIAHRDREEEKILRSAVSDAAVEAGRSRVLFRRAKAAIDEARNRDSRGGTWARADKLQVEAPIEARGRVVGFITLLGPESAWIHGAEEASFVKDVGQRVAMFVESARLYHKAQRAIGARDEFLSIASHELRTPVTSLKLQIQLLGRSLRGEGRVPFSVDNAVSKVQLAEEQIERLASLISALLDVSRIGAGQLVLDAREMDLSQMVQQVASRFADSAAIDGTPIDIDAEKPVVGRWDPMRIDQVVTNLITNALKYGNGSPIAVRVGSDEQKAVLSVKDRGIGIAPEHMDRIFDRFERAVSPVAYGGLGLGLYITRHIVGAHGGSIEVESEPGAGAEFRVTLPRNAGM